MTLSRRPRGSLLAPVLLLNLADVALAQPATNAAGAQQVRSPEVAPDRRVTFRLYSPHAQVVTLNGDFFTEGTAGPPMTKDSNGVWSHTLPPQPPGIHGYYFRVDGVRIPDPSNLLISSSAEFLKSYVEIAGDTPQPWSIRDVPHGQVHEVWYKNPALGQRRVYVYTPPGFDPATPRTYPTVYLLHSTTDNETFWTRVGRANFIVDNLLADGKIKPVLLVMPFGHTSVPRGPEEGAGGVDLYDVAVIGKDLVEHVIPLVEGAFHASPEPKDRAIFGFAMGGYQALTIGLNHPGRFGYVTGASANFRPTMDLAANFAGLTTDLEAAERGLTYMALMTGTGEASAIPQSRRVAEYLTGIGVRNEWTTPEGGTHTWHTWRGYFRDLLEHKLFADDPHAEVPVGASRFEKAVRAYEAEDKTAFPPRGAILLAGDSQFFRWKSSEQILEDFKTFVAKVRARQPRVPIAFSSITPGPGRWNEAEQRRQTNRVIKDYVATQRGLLFIDLWDAMLTADGQPREDLWVEDRIHPNHAGYLLRVKIMRPLLGKPEGKSR